MMRRCFVRLYVIGILTAIALGFCMHPVLPAWATASEPEEDVQVLTSGPIHEAFAETLAFDPEPGIVAPKAPPAVIEEIPPEHRPEGDVQWIPGYWAWDDERNDFIWVSGIWRVPPPGRQWIPGYWTSVRKGFQWISGYWADAKENVTEYLPEPPESVEVGPNTNALSPDHCWIPGCWIWYHGRYAWRPGYWVNMYPDWIWVPARYVWTPRGYIFVSGYWDYAVVHRGVLFAPVVFHPRVYMGVAFSFSPGFVIDLGVFSDCLFLRLGYSHYYFGDYYAPKYYRRGIYPWFSLHARRRGYDPIYAHQRWKNRHDHGWENRLQARFQERRDDEKARPPRMLEHRIGPDATVKKKAGAKRRVIALPLERTAKDKGNFSRFQPLDEKEKRKFTQREKDIRTYGKERRTRKTRKPDKVMGKTSEKSRPNKIKFSRSLITAKPADHSDRKKAQPNGYKATKPNPNVEPWKYRHNHGWENRLQTRFKERRDDEKARPPRMLEHRIGPDATVKKKAEAKRRVIALPLERTAKDKSNFSRFQPLDKKEKRKFTQREKDIRTYGKERQIRKTRKPDKVIGKTSENSGPNKIKFSRSPITAKPADHSDRKKAQPNGYKATKPNPNVEPWKRKNDVSHSWNNGHRSEYPGRMADGGGQKSYGKGHWKDNRGHKKDNRQ